MWQEITIKDSLIVFHFLKNWFLSFLYQILSIRTSVMFELLSKNINFMNLPMIFYWHCFWPKKEVWIYRMKTVSLKESMRVWMGVECRASTGKTWINTSQCWPTGLGRVVIQINNVCFLSSLKWEKYKNPFTLDYVMRRNISE